MLSLLWMTWNRLVIEILPLAANQKVSCRFDRSPPRRYLCQYCPCSKKKRMKMPRMVPRLKLHLLFSRRMTLKSSSRSNAVLWTMSCLPSSQLTQPLPRLRPSFRLLKPSSTYSPSIPRISSNATLMEWTL